MFDFCHAWLLHSYKFVVSSDLQMVAYLKDSGVFGITFPQQSRSNI